ncbi:hypothetical protein GGI15_003118 [Coemansia interrupta]|uniref:Uncharacterized protein n=1 Tax=Coemansia interrupta TaxID=1126814 RepID=A0A9W8LIE1_9FUNG|nr:hypothetical protein GGI15_003118 [Coemansia interrupta]
MVSSNGNDANSSNGSANNRDFHNLGHRNNGRMASKETRRKNYTHSHRPENEGCSTRTVETPNQQDLNSSQSTSSPVDPSTSLPDSHQANISASSSSISRSSPPATPNASHPSTPRSSPPIRCTSPLYTPRTCSPYSIPGSPVCNFSNSPPYMPRTPPYITRASLAPSPLPRDDEATDAVLSLNNFVEGLEQQQQQHMDSSWCEVVEAARILLCMRAGVSGQQQSQPHSPQGSVVNSNGYEADGELTDRSDIESVLTGSSWSDWELAVNREAESDLTMNSWSDWELAVYIGAESDLTMNSRSDRELTADREAESELAMSGSSDREPIDDGRSDSDITIVNDFYFPADLA